MKKNSIDFINTVDNAAQIFRIKPINNHCTNILEEDMAEFYIKACKSLCSESSVYNGFTLNSMTYDCFLDEKAKQQYENAMDDTYEQQHHLYIYDAL